MEKYEVVRQDCGHFTIFKGQEQYCDDDGNPMRYGCYWEAKEVCDELNNQIEKENKEDKYNVRYASHFTIFKGQEQCCNDDGNPMGFDDYDEAIEKCNELNNKMKQQENKKEQKMEKVVCIVWVDDEVEKNICQVFDNKEKAEQYAKVKKECDKNGFDYPITEESFLSDSDMVDELFQDMVENADDIDKVNVDKISKTLEKITGNKWTVIDLPESENHDMENIAETITNAAKGKTVLNSMTSSVFGQSDGGVVVAIEYK